MEQRNPERRWLALVLMLLLAGAGAVSGFATPQPRPVPAATNAPTNRLCELAQPLDQLFGCGAHAAASGSTAAPASSTTGAAPSGGSGQTLAAGANPPRSWTTPRYLPSRIIVRLRHGASQAQAAALFARADVRPKRSIPEIGAWELAVPAAHRAHALRLLRSSRWVRSAGRDPLVQAFGLIPNDAYWPDQWGLRAVGLTDAWSITRGVGSVVVAVIDTGVDRGQPDLQGALLPGIDLVNGGSDAADDQGHGTAVAGVIAARTDNQTGQAGVCGACSILPIKAMNAQGQGDEVLIAAAIVRATDAGARVINLSLGGPVGTQALADAVSYAEGKGAVVAAAAGNSGTRTPTYPAAYPGVVSVAGSDEANQLYPWSNYGDWVAIAAPGCNVAPLLGGGYANFCGTSSATPVVAGVVALAFSANPELAGQQIAADLAHGALAVAGTIRNGLVQAPAALAALGLRAPAVVSTATFRGTLSPSLRTRTYALPVPAGRLTLSLAFSGQGRLRLSVATAQGQLLARRSGTSPLRLSLSIPAATLRLTVSSTQKRRARFALTAANSHSG